MSLKVTRLIPSLAILVFCLVIAGLLQAQVAGSVLSGTITGPSGSGVAGAKVSVKNVATGQSREVLTNASGIYTISDLAPGDYEVSISAEGLSAKEAKVKLAKGATQTLDLALSAGLSLQDLGLSTNQTQGSAVEQARLDRRTHMLKVHQRLGLITAAPLVATVILGSSAGGKATSSTDRDVHAALGSVTAGMYFTTAYYAIFAPKVPGTEARGPIRWHKALAWIHGPGMVLTPILGAIAFSQKSNGEKVHGIASAHAPVAYTTAIAYGAAILSVSVKF